jgi:hypothetical protein
MQDPKLDLKHFHWHKETRTLTTELSSLPIKVLPFYITIENPQTGQSRVFRKANVDANEEGEVLAWKYENLSHSLRLTIWND